MKKVVVIIVVLFLVPATSYETSKKMIEDRRENITHVTQINATQTLGEDDGKDYWALLVAVGLYANNPDMNRPSMLKEEKDLYSTLIVSERWKESHIRCITGDNATVINILQGFRWLSKMADEDDICLVYLTTHGFPILWDLPPFDEKDGMDEALACYRGFLPFPNPWSWEPLANPFGILTDDIINYYLNQIHCNGICVIVDSCHSGGFNDNWSYAKKFDFAIEFAKDLRGRNRVVMTSVPEDKISYGSFFSHFVTEGLKGYADKNGDGVCSAEEAFWYAEPIVRKDTGMQPQIFDDYPGELSLTEVELPPSDPEVYGEEIGKVGTLHTLQIVSSDPEGDAIQYQIQWGDGIEEYTGFYESGKMVEISHVWNEERTYEMACRAIDEHGASSDWSYITLTMSGEHKVDQRQVEQHWGWLVNDTRWLAQSFIPSLDSLAKVELGMVSWNKGYTIEVSLRDNLTGTDLSTTSLPVEPSDNWETQWITFTFNNVKLIPGNIYYIICKSKTPGYGVAWVTSADDNPYKNGAFYNSYNSGKTWKDIEKVDGTFVTYG